MKQKILVLMTGGTIAQKVDTTGKLKVALGLDDLVQDFSNLYEITPVQMGAHVGANLTFATLCELASRIQDGNETHAGVVLITGTDSMEEVAFFLDRVLDVNIPVVLTGAMKPSDIVGYDGKANLSQALLAASDPRSRGKGVIVVMNDSVHAARYVRKEDSQLMGAFVSHPGPMAQIRRGVLYYYYESLPRRKNFQIPTAANLMNNVPVVTMCIGLQLSDGFMDGLDGLVIAGMGSGSISDALISALSPKWTAKIPIILSSRCLIGTSFDDSYYRGSREKYEHLGFRLSGYEELNPIQARIELLLELAATAR